MHRRQVTGGANSVFSKRLELWALCYTSLAALAFAFASAALVTLSGTLGACLEETSCHAYGQGKTSPINTFCVPYSVIFLFLQKSAAARTGLSLTRHLSSLEGFSSLSLLTISDSAATSAHYHSLAEVRAMSTRFFLFSKFHTGSSRPATKAECNTEGNSSIDP